MRLELDYASLSRELDKVKAKVFLGNNAAFLGSLLTSLKFQWDETCKTAYTDGLSIGWNPHWFLEIPEATRQTVLMHELWHVGKLHLLRGEFLDPELFNEACDHHINLGLLKEGYSFEGTNPLCDPRFKDMVEEDIYKILIKEKDPAPKTGAWGVPDDTGDLKKPADDNRQTVVNQVAKAVQTAAMSGHTDAASQAATELIKAYLEPKVEWEAEMYQFMVDLSQYRYTYKRPNRRNQNPNMFMPSRSKQEGRLTHLMYFLDCSGSISNKMLLRFNSEVKHIKDTFNPKKLTLVMFDTRITNRIVITENEQFDEAVIHGRGGTDFRPVREEIIKEQPTAAIIFTDLECEPLQPLPIPVPIIWIAVNARQHPVLEGKVIHIKE